MTWELCSTDTDVGPDEECTPYKTQLRRGSEGKTSDGGVDTIEEQLAQRVYEDGGCIIAKEAKEDNEGEKSIQKLSTGGVLQMNDDYEEPVNTQSLRFTDDAMSDSEGRASAEEESERSQDDQQGQDETMRPKIQVKGEEDKMHSEAGVCTVMALSPDEVKNMYIKENKVLSDDVDTPVIHEEMEDRDAMLLLASQDENKSDEGAKQTENQLFQTSAKDDSDFTEPPSFTSLHTDSQMWDNSGNVPEDELVIVKQEHVMLHSSESEKCEDAEEMKEEREQDAVNEEGNLNKPEDDTNTFQEESDDISTGHVACSEELMQNAKPELLSVEITDTEQEDMMNYPNRKSNEEVIAKKSDTTPLAISVGKRFFDKDQVEENLSSDKCYKECSIEAACTTPPITVKPQGESGQETRGEFKNILLGIGEGQLALSQELNPPPCEEAQGGVPEQNNEPVRDENTTQRFLEVQDSKEIQNTELPEEVESREAESLKNRGFNSGDDCLLVRHCKEEEQESRSDTKNKFDLVLEERARMLYLSETPFVESAIQEPLVDSMKTGIGHSETEGEMKICSAQLTDSTPKELQGGTEELLVQFEIDECDLKEDGVVGDDTETTEAAAAEEVVMVVGESLKLLDSTEQKMRNIFAEPVNALNSEQNSYRSQIMDPDSQIIEGSHETQPVLFEEEAAKDEMQNKNKKDIFNLQVAADELTAEWSKEKKTLNAEADALETQNQLKSQAIEISNKENEAAKPNDMNIISAEKVAKHVTESDTTNPTSELQDVQELDEEILDLWIQAALSEDADGFNQTEEPEPGREMDTKPEPLNEEPDENSYVLTEKNKKLSESNSWDSQSFSEVETSSLTADIRSLDHSLCVTDAQNSETQSESQDMLMEKADDSVQSYFGEEFLVTEAGFHPKSVESRHLNQESDESLEETGEETESTTETDAGVYSPKEEGSLLKFVDTVVEDDPLELTASDSAVEITHTESGDSRSGSEASLEDTDVTESGSQGDTCTEFEKLQSLMDEPLPGWSDDIVHSLPGLNRTEVAEQLTTQYGDQMEVLFHILAQSFIIIIINIIKSIHIS